ncbi:hypothetical protein BO82DRAFT_406630 [Aspergillus uvarum CBS 121591]|uniref:Uncharacterized protein n=1 Tax=Aspergillus uvarum CBS 121591 TaxID=1448315 RepID=A0A319BZU7_9EURO|nr:hypothetical protein BO82DRAFT_406630 [Aspergillus uvarum CBS 121591]PYH77019.1 hypothetical protein BO82DRAFT_406630 [Aspergillus uvarum CBS 121591]
MQNSVNRLLGTYMAYKRTLKPRTQRSTAYISHNVQHVQHGIQIIEQPFLQHEHARDPVRFIVTGRYLAVHYENSRFILERDYHWKGSIFHLSTDETEHSTIKHTLESFKVIRTTRTMSSMFVSLGHKIISRRTDSGRQTSARRCTSSLIRVTTKLEQVFISADGTDLYQPDTSFVLYAINSGFRNSGDAHNFGGELAFQSWPYNYGARFQLSSCQGKTRLSSNEGGYLVVTMGLADYLEPADDDGALMLIPRGLPSMFVLWDGDWYYAVNYLEASFSLTERVRTIKEAAVFQSVGCDVHDTL